MARTRLDEVQYTDEALVDSMGPFIILQKVEVHAVSETRDVHVPISPTEVQILTPLTVVDARQVGWETPDVFWFENFLDVSDGVAALDAGP
jgi:hypothetical protein